MLMHRSRRRRASFLAAALIVGFIPITSQPDASPLVAGNFSIAQEFLHGDAHVIILGDSLQNVLMGNYPSHWHPDHWTGQAYLYQANGGNSGAYSTTINQPFEASAGYYLPTETPPDGIRGISQMIIPHITFNGTAAGQEANLLTNRVLEEGLFPGQESIYYGGKWADRSTGSLRYSILTYANPNGVPSGNISFDVRINSVTSSVASLAINTLSTTPGFQEQSVTFAPEPWAPGASLTGAFRVLPGQAPPNGSNLILAGARISTGEPGFQLADMHYGGVGMDYFLDPANCTDSAHAT
ncbi:MAG: hypothetical protein JWO48_1723 [Bryobacterales bacterium]|nr:hypothetical protein [Bryobacterales bacterium]